MAMSMPEDRARELEKSYILTSGDPERPEKNKPVEPGWPFAPHRGGIAHE